MMFVISQAGDPGVPRLIPLRPLDKTFIVTEQMPLNELKKISGMGDATLRVVLKGNMLRDSWVKTLDGLGVRKIEAQISRDLNDIQVAQFRKIRNLDIIVDAPDGRVPANTMSSLAMLGPSRVRVLVLPGFDGGSLAESVRTIRPRGVILDARASANPRETILALGMGGVKWEVTVTAKQAEKLSGIFSRLGSVALNIEVGGTEIPPELVYLLDKAGVIPIFTILDSVDENAFKALFGVSQFTINILPASPVALNPRMIKMLREFGLRP
jgi:hypothetical protein